MGALSYPENLPCPSLASIQWAERRLLSALAGPRGSRPLSTDRLGLQSLEFFLRTRAQLQTWLDWISDDLVNGAAWFAASWPQPQGGVGVRRFVGTPSYPEYMPKRGGWRVVAECQVRGRGMLPVSTDFGPPSDFDLSASANSGTTPAAGIVMSSLSAAGVYQVSFPTGRLYVAHSTWGSDSDPLAGGLPWLNYYQVTDDMGVTTNRGSTGVQFATPEAAFAATATIQLSGSTSFTFWIVDGIPGDNRGGLSIRFQRVA